MKPLVPISTFLSTRIKKKLNGDISLAGVILNYLETTGTVEVDVPKLFRDLARKLGPPEDNATVLCPPGRVIWKNATILIVPKTEDYDDVGIAGVEGEEHRILEVARILGFDICPICWALEIVNSSETECGHRFCNPCLKTLASNSVFTCPLCRHYCSLDRISAVSVQASAPLECVCGTKFSSLLQFEQHLQAACPLRMIRCSCGTGVEARHWKTHREAEPQRGHFVNRNSKSMPRACNNCGQSGKMPGISLHEEKCNVVSCPTCQQRFRADKFAQHRSCCFSQKYPCLYSGCLEEFPASNIAEHVLHNHPILIDTGVYYNKEDSLVVLRDSTDDGLLFIAQKTKADEDDMANYSFLGWNGSPSLQLKSDSPLIAGSLKDNIECILRQSAFSSNVFPRLYLSEDTRKALASRHQLSHRDAELLCLLERRYKDVRV